MNVTFGICNNKVFVIDALLWSYKLICVPLFECGIEVVMEVGPFGYYLMS